MKTVLNSYRLLVWVGIVFFPLFFILDCFVYPDHKWLLLGIRLVVIAFLFAVLFVIRRSRPRTAVMVTNGAFVAAAFSISLMCYVSGEGFRSPYYAGLFLFIIPISSLVNMEPRQYLSVLSAILAQHFILLSFAPFDMRGALCNLFFLGSCCVIGVLLHARNYRMLKEIQTLRGFLPICAQCKKIRDDKGYWNQIEAYIQERSDAVFSHGLCPECAQKYFEEIDRITPGPHGG